MLPDRVSNPGPLTYECPTDCATRPGEYIRVVALFVLQKLDLKMMSDVLRTSERQLFWELIYGH